MKITMKFRNLEKFVSDICFLYFMLLLQFTFVSYNFICCNEDPSSGATGPGGSTFHQLDAWPNLQISTFVDLNADRRMDIVFVNDDGTKLFAIIEPGAKSFQQSSVQQSITNPNIPSPVEILSPGFSEPIRSVASADFNGDSRADLLLVTSTSQNGPFNAYIAFGLGGNDRGKFGSPAFVNLFKSQPLVCDLNSDLIADLYGETQTSERIVHFGGSTFENRSSRYAGPTWSHFGYSAFGDVNGDGVPDIIILVDDQSTLQLQVIYRSKMSVGELPDVTKAELISLDVKFLNTPKLNLGLFVLNDFDSDGYIDLLQTGCTTHDCLDSSLVYLYSFKDKKWSPVDVNWTPAGIVNRSDTRWSLSVTPTLAKSQGLCLSNLVGPSVGDVNLDGRPDLAMGITSWSNQNRIQAMYPAILLNKGRNENNHLSLEVYLLPGATLPSDNKNIRQVAFFDQFEDGVLDLFAVSISSSSTPSVQLFHQNLPGDPYFLKVTVLNGLCRNSESCSDGRFPYGLTVPSVSTTMNTEAASGGRQLSSALLGFQSCCGALQVPFEIFGLGPFANYVEKLFVSIPSSKTHLRLRLFQFLVPKSQIVINPYPPDDPSAWTTKLFLQPLYDMKVVYIAITLLCVCVLLLIIIGILQWVEFREDRLEKQKESQRFHFDAM